MVNYAVLMDGGFVVKKFEAAFRRFPSADDIERLAYSLRERCDPQCGSLLRVYFYHARPASGLIVNPLDKAETSLASTAVFTNHERLIDTLELKPNFAVRLGETVINDWRLGSQAMASLLRKPRPIEARDLVPNISQKGVDLRIGMDMARLALRSNVSTIVVVSGDSDLIPAFKFVRREGLRLVLETLGHGVKRELKAHADLVWETDVTRLPTTAAASSSTP
jgi:uncharacterized LabA/DUF88 family protein